VRLLAARAHPRPLPPHSPPQAEPWPASAPSDGSPARDHDTVRAREREG